jgi:protein TonB
MDRKILLYGVPALLLALIAAGLLRHCGQVPAGAPPVPETVPAPPPAQAPTKKKSAPKQAALAAPRLLNMDDLQVNIRKYYPEAEHRAGKAGRVMLAMVVGKDGSLSDVRVEKSGGENFDAAAIKVAQAMKFSPATRAGVPTAVEISEGIDFEFDGK